MYKVITVLYKKNEISARSFQEYWLTCNREIVSRLPGLMHYCQSHTLLSAYEKMRPAADGIAEYWFESRDDYTECENSRIFEDVQRDILKFCAVEKNIRMIVREEVIKNSTVSPDGVKSIELVTKKEGMEAEIFQKYWKEIHGPLGASIPPVNRYIQNHEVLESYNGSVQPKLDGLAITWFDSTQKMRESALTQEYSNTRADEENFLTIPLDFIITKEHIIF